MKANQIQPADIREFQYLDRFSDLLDSRFRIPGTNIRFGLDALIGLIPYGGDVVTFIFSGMLVAAMAKHGASGNLVAKMLVNVFLDTVIGAIPLVGDIFDISFKANRRNYRLLREHYHEGSHKGSAWPLIFIIVLALLMMLAFTAFLVWKVFKWIFQ